MGQYIYLTDEMKKQFQAVTNTELNDLLKDARGIDPSILIEERFYTNKKLFRTPKKLVKYTVYHEAPAYNGSTYQARIQQSCMKDVSNVVNYKIYELWKENATR